MTQQPSTGRIVHYTLSDSDELRINARRTDGPAIQERLLDNTWPVGAQAHIGNKAAAGDVLSAMVVAVQCLRRLDAKNVIQL